MNRRLNAIETEAAELVNISQQKVLHLQCHIGTGTLQLVRCGALIATGLDPRGMSRDGRLRLLTAPCLLQIITV